MLFSCDTLNLSLAQAYLYVAQKLRICLLALVSTYDAYRRIAQPKSEQWTHGTISWRRPQEQLMWNWRHLWRYSDPEDKSLTVVSTLSLRMSLPPCKKVKPMSQWMIDPPTMAGHQRKPTRHNCNIPNTRQNKLLPLETREPSSGSVSLTTITCPGCLNKHRPAS